MSSKTNHVTNKKFPARFLSANCAEISKVTSGGGNWILWDLGPPEAKAFDRKYSSCIMKYDYENLISPSFREFYKLSIDI